MCLGIPGRIVDIETGGVAMGRVDFDGVEREVCLAYVPDASIGDYVIVNVGFALRRLEASEAQETFDLLRSARDAERPV